MKIDKSVPAYYLSNIFALSYEEVISGISKRFYYAFCGFFEDKSKLEKHIRATQRIFDLVEGKDRVILDACCGFGITSIIFASLGAKKVYAIDFSQEEINGFHNILSQLPPLGNLDIKLMDSQKMDFPNDFFDVIIAADCISHIHDYGKFLEEIKRILKRGGVFYIYDSNSSWSILHQWQLRKYWNMVERGPVDPKIGLEKPFRVIREEMILGYCPIISQCSVKHLVAKTQGMWGDEIKKAVEEYQAAGKVKPKKGFRYIDPRNGMLAESPIDPFRLQNTLSKFGFKARVLPPYFYYTFPFLSLPLSANLPSEVVKSLIKKIIRYFYPLSLLTTPRFEILAENEKV